MIGSGKPTKDEVLSHFELDVAIDGETIELIFTEGGGETRVFSYTDLNQAVDLFEEDALMYWSRALNRTWKDEE